eukprot:Pgem_evm1s8814
MTTQQLQQHDRDTMNLNIKQENKQGNSMDTDDKKLSTTSTINNNNKKSHDQVKLSKIEKKAIKANRPNASYATLIAKSILASPNKRITLNGIYKWIGDTFPYYNNPQSGSWKNCIRHNLSLNKCFVKTKETEEDGKKTIYWGIAPDAIYHFSKDGEYMNSRKLRKCSKSGTTPSTNILGFINSEEEGENNQATSAFTRGLMNNFPNPTERASKPKLQRPLSCPNGYTSLQQKEKGQPKQKQPPATRRLSMQRCTIERRYSFFQSSTTSLKSSNEDNQSSSETFLPQNFAPSTAAKQEVARSQSFSLPSSPPAKLSLQPRTSQPQLHTGFSFFHQQQQLLIKSQLPTPSDPGVESSPEQNNVIPEQCFSPSPPLHVSPVQSPAQYNQNDMGTDQSKLPYQIDRNYSFFGVETKQVYREGRLPQNLL